MDILSFIQLHHLQSYIYLLIFLFVIFDAAIVVFAAMFLLVQGAVSPVPTVIVLILGVFAEQMLWYEVGRRLGKWERLMSWLDKPAIPFDKHLISKPLRTLALSKFIYGIHRAMLVRAGMLKINFKQYFYIAIICIALWLGIIGGLGLVFSASYEALKRYLKYAELVPLGMVVIYFIVDWRLSKKLKKEI